MAEPAKPREEFTVEAAKEAVKPVVDLSAYRGIWVFVEQRNGRAMPVSWQLLGQAVRLARELEDGTPVGAVVLGHGVRHLADEAIAYGADVVYLIDDPVLTQYRTDPYAHGVVKLVRQYRPEVFLFGSDTLGRDIAGAVATDLPTGLTADATILSIEKETRILGGSRPDFGGKLMSTILCKRHRPQMATCRPGVFPLPPRDPSRSGEVVVEELGLTEDQVPTKVLGFIPEEHVDLSSAQILVSGGRGLGSPKAFQLLQELADVLGGKVSASRAAVMAGWISYDHQVGQTGQTVRPKLYIACGISGQIQHLVGMQEAEVVLAINKDPNAPIFKIANYGIVGDLHEVVPALTRILRERLGKNGDRPAVGSEHAAHGNGRAASGEAVGAAPRAER